MCRLACSMLAILLLLSPAALSAADDTATMVKAGDAAFAERKFERARSLYERALANGVRFDADLPHARNLGLTYLNCTPPDLANGIKWLRIAIGLDPQADGVRAQLASALLRSGDADAAIQNYRILVDAHPQAAEYVIALAGALRQAGRSDAALQLLQAATNKFPTLIPVRVEYARVLNFTRQFPEAKRQFLAVLAVDPENVIAQVGAAKATSFQGDQETAIAMYDRILQQHPGLYDALIGKAFSLMWSGRIAQARPLFEEGLRRHPDDSEVREALAGLPAPPGDTPHQAPERGGHRVSIPHPHAPIVRSTQPHASAATTMTTAEPGGRSEVPNPKPAQGQSRVLYILAACLAIAAIAFPLTRTLRRRSRRAIARNRFLPAPTFGSPAPAADIEAEKADGDLLTTQVNTLASADVIAREEQSSEALSGQDFPRDEVRVEHPFRIALLENVAPTGARARVLLVGGSDNLLELECRWLALEGTDTTVERKWVPAIVRLLNSPFDLLVLNATTADGWTSARMSKWIRANHAHLRDRTIVILSTGTTGAEDPEARYLLEPFRADDWQRAVRAIIQSRAAHTRPATKVDVPHYDLSARSTERP